jgi:beta-galactosidase
MFMKKPCSPTKELQIFHAAAGLLACAALWSPLLRADAGQCHQSLNGAWQFTTNAAAANTKDAKWDSITVPGNWDTLPAYCTHIGKGWYQRTFTVPPEWNGKHVRLQFDAVYETAEVWLNGTLLGSHRGGYTPFEFDVTRQLQPGENTVVVCADNTFRRGAWWAWGGISRDVTLIANDDTRIVWQHIRSEPDLKAGTARVLVEYKLANAGDSAQEVSLASSIDGMAESALARTVMVAAHSLTNVTASVDLPRERVRLWHFDHPNLYTLATRLTAGGQLRDEISSRFGIRKIEVTKDSLLLNGERIRVCGFNRVSDSNRTGNTEPDALVRQDVDLMKRAGASFARLMHLPQAPNLLDYLDEKGFMIFAEIPVWGEGDPNMKAGNPLPEQWMREMIERDYNHPCIVGWSVGNELKQHYDYVDSMIKFTRTLDPHRLINYVSFTGSKSYPTNDPISLCDLLMHNTYGGNNAVLAENLRGKWPNLPIFFSEFGASQIGTSSNAIIPGMDKRFRPLEALPYVIGISVWTFNDYRSNYKGTPPSGNREWGVVTVDRQPKAAYWQMRKLFSPVHSLTVSNGVASVTPRRVEEIPSYTLRGYKLKWDGGQIALPDLKPGDPVWTSDVKSKPGTVVKLFSPTGYDLADSE